MVGSFGKFSLKPSVIFDRILHLKLRAPQLFWCICVWFLFELVGFLILPAFVPKNIYLSWYLGSQSIEATQRFLMQKDFFLIPCAMTGWRNRPNMVVGNWVIDQNGVRPSLAPKKKSKRTQRTILLGSSMVNGGTHINNDETISAFLEDEYIEVFNFGTMMYSLDQCMLFYQNELHRFGANVVVIGIESLSLQGLRNHYIPFRAREEKNMPYIKPRYELVGDALTVISVKPETLLADVPNGPRLLKFCREHDHFYRNFAAYCRLGFLPLGAFCMYIYGKIDNLLSYFFPNEKIDKLLIALLKEMVNSIHEDGAHVLFVMLPNRQDFSRGGIHRFLPDLYERILRIVESQKFTVIDARQVLLNSGQLADQLFHEDGIHYKPPANRLIALAIRSKVISYGKIDN